MEEQVVEHNIRKHLIDKGWRIRKAPKRTGEHGVDIHAWHPVKRRLLHIEVKGDSSGKYKIQSMHGAFYTVLGQIISRMDIQGNDPKRGRIYAIGIPHSWYPIFRRKIQKMNYGWRLLKLRTYLVEEDGKVVEKPFTSMLK